MNKMLRFSVVTSIIPALFAAQGIQAQTLSVLELAKEEGLVLIPVLNKIEYINL